MNFCSQCGKKVIEAIPENDNRLRFVCSSCGFIHYQNPNVVCGVLPLVIDVEGNEKILLCKRAIEPRLGYWTLPAGFMENQETLEEAATRESVEEANLKLGELKLYLVMSLPHINQVYMMYVGHAENNFSPGSESLETKLYTQDEIPWDELAFPVIRETLTRFFTDREQQTGHTQIDQLPVHNTVYRAKKISP